MEIWGGRGNEVWCGDGGVQVMCEGEGVAMWMVCTNTHVQYGDVLSIFRLELVLKVPKKQPFHPGAERVFIPDQKVQWLLGREWKKCSHVTMLGMYVRTGHVLMGMYVRTGHTVGYVPQVPMWPYILAI